MHLTSKDAPIYVAGHRGMIGSAVWRRLEQAGYTSLVGRTAAELDLRDPAATRAFFAAEWPDFVVLAAARVGGILANDRYPADFLGDNLAIEQRVPRRSARPSKPRRTKGCSMTHKAMRNPWGKR
jgi:GDP-L-fucose synthase